MKLQYIFGKAGSGKLESCINDILIRQAIYFTSRKKSHRKI